MPPTAQTFSGVKKKLRNSTQEWMQGFLDNLGMVRLLDCVDTLAGKRVTQLADALVLMGCVECIKAVCNSKVGVAVFAENPDYCRRLVKGRSFKVILDLGCPVLTQMGQFGPGQIWDFLRSVFSTFWLAEPKCTEN